MQPRSNLIKSLCEISNNIYIYPRLLNFLFVATFSNQQGSNSYPNILIQLSIQIIKRQRSNQTSYFPISWKLHKKTCPNQNYYKIQFDRGQKRENFAKHFQTHRVSAPRFNNILIPRDPVSPNATHTLPPPSIPSSILRYPINRPTTVRKFRSYDNVRSHLISIIALPPSSSLPPRIQLTSTIFSLVPAVPATIGKSRFERKGGEEWKRQPDAVARGASNSPMGPESPPPPAHSHSHSHISMQR